MTNLLNSEYFFIFLKLLILCSSFASLFLLALYLFPDEKQLAARRRLGVSDEAARPNRIAILKWLRPLFQPLVETVASKENLNDLRKSLHKKLVSADLRDELTPDEFISFKWVLAGLVTFIILYLCGASGNPLPLGVWPVVAVLSYYAGDLWLSQRIQIRRRAITRSLPYTMDLLTLSVEAGLDFIASIQRLTQRNASNALIQEYNQMLREIRLGTSRSDALRNLSDRLQIEEISSFTTLLIQADQLGAPIGNVLRAQSEQLRTKRFQLAEAAGAKASQMVLFPLVLFIFPAIFIVVLGPTILSILQQGIF